MRAVVQKRLLDRCVRVLVAAGVLNLYRVSVLVAENHIESWETAAIVDLLLFTAKFQCVALITVVDRRVVHLGQRWLFHARDRSQRRVLLHLEEVSVLLRDVIAILDVSFGQQLVVVFQERALFAVVFVTILFFFFILIFLVLGLAFLRVAVLDDFDAEHWFLRAPQVLRRSLLRQEQVMCRGEDLG